MKINKKAITIIAIFLILIAIIFIAGIPKKVLKIIYKKDYSEYVEKYAKQYDVDENLVYAVIKAESNFRVNAESGKGAIGLMQLIESTAKDIAKQINIDVGNKTIKEILLNSESNINIGTKYLSILIKKYGNIELAITAYNAGIGTVDNWVEKGILKEDGSNIEKIPYLETNNYVRKILRDYKIYSNL